MNAPRERRILVVDDNPDVASIVRLAVGKLPGKVHVTSEADPERALDRLAHERFDLVLSDHRMRTMDGLELLALAPPAHESETRLLFTAHGTKLDPTAIAGARVDGVLEKGMMLEAMREVIDAVLEREPSTMAALKRNLAARAGTR